jgi:ubiquinone/menaquinone biosynthesis C-methylase UbiE
MDAKQAVIDTWKTESSPDYAYFDAVEHQAGGFWADDSLYRKEFDKLDLSSVLEIACGKGRHSAQIADRCGKLILADTSTDAIAFAAQRFSDKPNVSTHLIADGETLPFISNASLTAAFSYDAMVHFEALTMASYLREMSRVLVPGGMALFHHSNYSAAPENNFNQNPGWRNFMTYDLMRYLASRAGLKILSHHTIDWAAPGSDALTLFVK